MDFKCAGLFNICSQHNNHNRRCVTSCLASVLVDHNLVLWICIVSPVLCGYLVKVVLFRMYKLVNVRMPFCMTNGLQWSVYCICYITLMAIFWSITIFCSSVEFAAPHATMPNLRWEEKRAWYVCIRKRSWQVEGSARTECGGKEGV